MDTVQFQDLMDEADRLRKENERLRSLIKDIVLEWDSACKEALNLCRKIETEREIRESLERSIATIPAMCAGDFSLPCALHIRQPIEDLFNKGATK